MEWFGRFLRSGGRVVLLMLLVSSMDMFFSSSVAWSRDSAYAPQPGSRERKEILDALRKDIYRYHGIRVVFVVEYLKVYGGWAWIEALPQSQDGENRYEGVAALLKLRGRRWQVAELACAEPDNPDCFGDPRFFRGLMHRYPALPAAVLPPGSF